MSKIKFLLITTFVLLSLSAIAQVANKSKLQKEYKNLKSEIKELEKTLNKRIKEKKIGMQEINTINKKIEARKKLVENTKNQLNLIDQELKYKQKEFEKNKEDEELYKQEYIKLLRWRYKNREQNYASKLAFIIESSSLREAWSRLKYIKRYSDYAQKQANILQTITDRIKYRVDELQSSKIEKSNVIESCIQNQLQLEKEKNNRDEMISMISKEMEKIKADIDKKNRAALEINNKIKNIIAEEIRKQREKDMANAREKQETQEKAAKAAKASGATPVKVKTVEEIYAESHTAKLSNSFRGSKGNLPLPVSRGVVVSRFGRVPHPDAPELMIENNGIDIKTSNNAEVSCMYEGTVVKIFELPNYEKAVLVQHGDYYTMYSHLSSVSVSVGSSVEARQEIGRCAYSTKYGYAYTHIQIWHLYSKLNPSSWIKGA